jgi:hypothetical protein
MKTAQDKAATLKHRAMHHSALATLASKPNANGMAIWRKLHRLELEAHDAATAQCNGAAYGSQPFRPDYGQDGEECDGSPWELYAETVRARVAAIFGKLPDGFSYNQDARGYALKIRPERAKVPEGMQTDWGGNGLLAAEIE